MRHFENLEGTKQNQRLIRREQSQNGSDWPIVAKALRERGQPVLATQVRLAARYGRPEHPRIIAEHVARLRP